MGWIPGALAAALLVAHCSAGAARAAELPTNDYPTAARADYVFGCMQVNGQTRDALERCACSIDVIASLLSYDQYEEADTVMRMRQRGGKNASMFLSMPMLRAKVDDLKRAQIEADARNRRVGVHIFLNPVRRATAPPCEYETIMPRLALVVLAVGNAHTWEATFHSHALTLVLGRGSGCDALTIATG